MILTRYAIMICYIPCFPILVYIPIVYFVSEVYCKIFSFVPLVQFLCMNIFSISGSCLPWSIYHIPLIFKPSISHNKIRNVTKIENWNGNMSKKQQPDRTAENSPTEQQKTAKVNQCITRTARKSRTQRWTLAGLLRHVFTSSMKMDVTLKSETYKWTY